MKTYPNPKQKTLAYLKDVQQEGGSWIPLWFGNQLESRQQNPVYGTAKVLISLSSFIDSGSNISKAVKWLLEAQDNDGGWGGGKSKISSIEETSLAVDALACILNQIDMNPEFNRDSLFDIEQIQCATSKAVAWLIEKTNTSTIAPAPIGLYFARLWYYEELYPVIFALSALKRIKLENG